MDLSLSNKAFLHWYVFVCCWKQSSNKNLLKIILGATSYTRISGKRLMSISFFISK